jgi:hypothetical protein
VGYLNTLFLKHLKRVLVQLLLVEDISLLNRHILNLLTPQTNLSQFTAFHKQVNQKAIKQASYKPNPNHRKNQV